MNIEKYLDNIMKYDNMLDYKYEQLERLRSKSVDISPKLSENKVQTSFDNNKMGTIVAEIIELENEIETIKHKRNYIIKEIEEVEDLIYFMVLSDRYIKGLTYTEIATHIDVSDKHIYKVHKNALLEFEKKHKTYEKLRKQYIG